MAMSEGPETGDPCMYACMHACMYVRMYVCMYICMYACAMRSIAITILLVVSLECSVRKVLPAAVVVEEEERTPHARAGDPCARPKECNQHQYGGCIN